VTRTGDDLNVALCADTDGASTQFKTMMSAAKKKLWHAKADGWDWKCFLKLAPPGNSLGMLISRRGFNVSYNWPLI
jgi:hypothetical protein